MEKIYKFSYLLRESSKEEKFNDILINFGVMDTKGKINLDNMSKKINDFLSKGDNKKKFLEEVDKDIADGKIKQPGLLSYRKLVDEKAKVKQNALFDRIWDAQKAVFTEAENIKKMPLDANNSEHAQIIDQAAMENNFDEKKIIEALRAKGYIIEES